MKLSKKVLALAKFTLKNAHKVKVKVYNNSNTILIGINKKGDKK